MYVTLFTRACYSAYHHDTHQKKQKAFFLPLVTMNGHISGHYSALWGQSGESYNEGDAFAVLFV